MQRTHRGVALDTVVVSKWDNWSIFDDNGTRCDIKITGCKVNSPTDTQQTLPKFVCTNIDYFHKIKKVNWWIDLFHYKEIRTWNGVICVISIVTQSSQSWQPSNKNKRCTRYVHIGSQGSVFLSECVFARVVKRLTPDWWSVNFSF